MGPIRHVRKWIDAKRFIAQKEGGLKEKKESVAMKMEVAMTILRSLDPNYDRRVAQQPTTQERRSEWYDYHRKLA